MSYVKLSLRAALALLAVVALDSSVPTAALFNIHPQDPICLSGCAEFRDICRARASLDCEAIYAGNQAAIMECTVYWRGVCDTDYKGCREYCKYIASGCTPLDPPPCPQFP